jgi:hypothetical protein
MTSFPAMTASLRTGNQMMKLALFREMRNYCSLAKWKCCIPYVHRIWKRGR